MSKQPMLQRHLANAKHYHEVAIEEGHNTEGAFFGVVLLLADLCEELMKLDARLEKVESQLKER